MTPEQRNLAALYGLCKKCQSPRRAVQTSNVSTRAVDIRLVCTKDENHDA